MGNKASLMLQDEEIRQISEETGFSAQQIEKLYPRFTHLDRTNCGALSKNDLLSIPELAINPLCDRLIEMFFGGAGHNPEDDEERINFRQFTRVLAAFRTSNHVPHGHVGNQVKNGTRAERGANSSRSRPESVAAGLASSSLGRQQYTSKRIRSQHNNLSEPGLDTRAQKIGPDSRRSRSNSNSYSYSYSYSNNRVDDSAPVVASLSDSLRDKLYFLFKIYDADNDGRISFNDLKSILKMMVGNYIEDVQLDKIATRAFVEVDRDNDGFVEFGEFCRVFAGKDMDDKLRVRFF